MELRAWQQCQRNPAVQCTGTFCLLPPSWDTVSALYSQVLKVVSKFPGHRRLVLCFAYRGASVKVDLGDVKAAGVVCMLGLGIGLGTLFVYRLYHRYIRPFLDALQYPDPEDSVCSQLSFLLDSSDSGVDGAKSKNSEKQLPALQYGVALGGKGLSSCPQTQTLADRVRLRRTGTRRKPVRKSRTERDSSRRSEGPYLSPVLHNANFRDSFYSTAESGFETLPEFYEDNEVETEEPPSPRQGGSVLSGRQNERYLSSSSGERTNSSPSGNKTVVDVGALDVDGSSDAALTVLHPERLIQTAKSSPAHKPSRSPLGGAVCSRKPNSYPHSLDDDYDPSLDASESIQSFNSSEEEWSWEEGDKEASALQPSHSAMTDIEFRESLMQRVHDWATIVEECRRSPSPAPDRTSPMQMRRSRSLDRQVEEPLLLPDIVSSSEQAENTTIKNLECLETEFHDIQGEFESITSKLRDLIEQGQQEATPDKQLCGARPRPTTLPRRLCPPPHRNCRERGRGRSRSPLVCGRRTRWENMPKTRSRSSSSRASSVEFSWDCGEVGGGSDTDVGGRLPGEVAGPGGDHASVLSMQGTTQDKEVADFRVKETRVGEAVPIEEYAQREWKGETHKAKTILQGYSTVPDLFHCRRLRQIRGDHFCALRSTLFQVLVGGHRVTRGWPGPVSLIDQFHALQQDKMSGLDRWLFAQCPPLEGRQIDRLNKVTHCVLTLYTTIEDIASLASREERENRAASLLNDDPQTDLELMEALKLMMLFSANSLHRQMNQGVGHVPPLAPLLFAGDTSTMVGLVQNRLNAVGSCARVNQVELSLLAHTLGVKVRVAHLHRYGQHDFDSSVPEDAPDAWPCVSLLAEDDGRYTVPAP